MNHVMAVSVSEITKIFASFYLHGSGSIRQNKRELVISSKKTGRVIWPDA
jgi:hypothetical protein